MNKVFFIADLHCGPNNNRTLADRGFKFNWEKHTETVIEGINSVISKSDRLFICGDLGWKDNYNSLKNTLQSLNTKQIQVIRGNHDNMIHLQRLKSEGVIQNVHDLLDIKINKTYFTLCHYPLIEWNHFFNNSIMIHGHCHNHLFELPYKIVDVGIDNIGYKPIEANEIIERLKDKNNVDEYKNRILV